MRFVRLLEVMFAILVVALAGCRPQGGMTDQAYERTVTTGKLRVGYISYPPSFITDPNTHRFSGISCDVLVQAASNLGLKVEFVEEVAWGSMIEAIDSGRVDLIATGIWPTAARGKRADFVRPIFYSPVRAYVRSDDHRFDGHLQYANSPTVRVAVIDGEMAAAIATSDFPLTMRDALPQTSDVSQLILEVASRKADITFVEPAIASAYMHKHPGVIEPVSGVDAVRQFPTEYLLSKDSPKLKSMLNIALDEMVRNGDVNRILAHYEEEPGTFIPVRHDQ